MLLTAVLFIKSGMYMFLAKLFWEEEISIGDTLLMRSSLIKDCSLSFTQTQFFFLRIVSGAAIFILTCTLSNEVSKDVCSKVNTFDTFTKLLH